VKIGIIGANGQLGSSLARVLGGRGIEYVGFTRPELDVTDLASVTTALGKHRPDIVINTAAYHRVDQCEDTPGETFLVNAVGARNVMVACNQISAVQVYISSDYVFDGAKGSPYVETDNPRPLSVYGAGKLAAEFMTRIGVEEFFIVRSTGLYAVGGSSGKGGNFIETMLKLARGGQTIRVVDDQVLTPTYAVDLAGRICDLIQTKEYGLYHMTSTGEVSWHGFAAKIFELSKVEADLHPTTSEEFGARAARPHYSVLDNLHTREIGLEDMRPWDEALADYLEERNQT
jgi:dTDP-4-dehydrorhamnose reductase